MKETKLLNQRELRVCPKCQGHCGIYKTKGLTQYRKCQNPKCGHTFKAIRATPEYLYNVVENN